MPNQLAVSPAPQLQRRLQARHLTMIAIGGSIGTGLFLASGASIAQAGPGGALVAYGLIGLMVYCLMTSLGELAAFMPLSGSFALYGARFVEPGFGFALGWNYWYNWAITVAVELVAAALVMQYWFPAIPGLVWSSLFLLITFLLNFFSVKGFGEAEYWCSLIKVTTVILFVITGLMMIIGILWQANPKVLTPWKLFTINDAPFAGGLPAILSVALIAGFSFQGTELIGIAAGESSDPQRTIPDAIKQIFWRILLFYGLAIVIISCLIPYTDKNLLNNDLSQISMSPFTLLFKRAGLAFAASMMNAVILSAILSAGNAGLYASTRMLYTLAMQGMAPSCFAKLSSTGIPRTALYATTAVAALCFLSALFGEQKIYIWLLSASAMSGFIVWVGIALSHYRFRRGYLLQGYDIHALPYRAKWFPCGPIMALIFCLLIMLGQGIPAFIDNSWNWQQLCMTYLGIPLFLLLWGGYRYYHKSSWVSYQAMDFNPYEKDNLSVESINP
ncbi:MAG: amino acid permease [Candidatus Symbiodolus clandestinus]